MTEFEQVIQDAIKAEDIPGCVLMSTNRDGSFKYEKAFGKLSMDPANAKPLGFDTIMWIASCTKLLTCVSAMQLVERGLVNLDDSVYKHLPELESYPVLTGVEEGTGKPIEAKQESPITLRHLLTHSSGLTYDAIHPLTMAWLAYHKRETGTKAKLLERFAAPLVFQPGTSWMYGPSIDFVGLLVERISGQKLDEYMKVNIWEPLGIKDMTFFLSQRPDLKARMADMSMRKEDGKVHHHAGQMTYQTQGGGEVEDCMGGQGIFSSAGEYIKVLHAVLTADENGGILKKESVDVFFSQSLGEGSKATLNAICQDPATNNAFGGTQQDIEKGWGLGGISILGDAQDGKKAGTMSWGGYPNLIWWIDRKAGLCGLYAGQVIPPGDAKCAVLNRKFEAEMYRQLAASQKVSSSRL